MQQEEQSKNVTDRLVKDASEKVFRQGKVAENYMNEISQTCTFNPSINPISKTNEEILQNNSFYKYQKDFVTRQYLMADNLKEKLEKKAKNEENCNFAPKINKITQFIIEADPERAEETMKEKIERLARKVIFLKNKWFCYSKKSRIWKKESWCRNKFRKLIMRNLITSLKLMRFRKKLAGCQHFKKKL